MSGATDRSPVMCHMQDLESALADKGTEQMHTLIVGEAITGPRAGT